MDTAITHPVPDRVKPSFVIYLTSGHSGAQGWASECQDVKNYKWRLNPVWHRMLYSCTNGNSGRQRVNHVDRLSSKDAVCPSDCFLSNRCVRTCNSKDVSSSRKCKWTCTAENSQSVHIIYISECVFIFLVLKIDATMWNVMHCRARVSPSQLQHYQKINKKYHGIQNKRAE